MTSQDLFAAIGGVETSRLERSSRDHHVEESNMYLKKNTGHRLSTLTAAALIAALLAVTAFAAAGFILFDSPGQMLDALFGGSESAEWVVPDNSGETAAQYRADRVPMDENAAEALQPRPVGQSVTWGGHTLTVDANLYDPATRCGFVTYTIENPDGIRPYTVEPDGEVFFPNGELLESNQYGRSYIIRESCSDTTLCAAYYYMTDSPETTDLELTLSFWAAIDDPEAFMAMPPEEAIALGITDCKEKIVIPADDASGVPSLSLDGAVLSPFSVRVELAGSSYLRTLVITFRDGSEYVVKDDSTLNLRFEISAADTVTLMLNRLVDIDRISAVTVN